MTQKRKDRPRTTPAPLTPAVAEPPPGTGEGDAASDARDTTSMPLFWRVFGGAAVAAVAVVVVAVYSNMQAQISRQRQELNVLGKDLRKDMARISENYAGMIKKEDHQSRIRATYDTIRELRADRGDLTALKERCALMLDVGKTAEADQRSLASEMRKLRDGKAASDERDQLLREIRALRERIAQLEIKPGKPRVLQTGGSSEEQEKR